MMQRELFIVQEPFLSRDGISSLFLVDFTLFFVFLLMKENIFPPPYFTFQENRIIISFIFPLVFC